MIGQNGSFHFSVLQNLCKKTFLIPFFTDRCMIFSFYYTNERDSSMGGSLLTCWLLALSLINDQRSI